MKSIEILMRRKSYLFEQTVYNMPDPPDGSGDDDKDPPPAEDKDESEG